MDGSYIPGSMVVTMLGLRIAVVEVEGGVFINAGTL